MENNIEDRETLLEIKNLTKIYGNEKKESIKLKKSGLTKDEVYSKTRTTIALWDVSIC